MKQILIISDNLSHIVTTKFLPLVNGSLTCSWEAYSSSDSQDIPRILWSPKVLYSLHNGPQQVTVLCQINLVHTLKHYSLQIHFNIILPPMPRFSPWSLSFRLPNRNFVRIYLPMLTTWPAHRDLFDLITLIIFVDEQKLCNLSQCSFLQPPVISPILSPNVLLSNLFSNTSICVLLTWRTKFHTHRTQEINPATVDRNTVTEAVNRTQT
jgi:hypothetical protein